jgi:hypothetical protein
MPRSRKRQGDTNKRLPPVGYANDAGELISNISPELVWGKPVVEEDCSIDLVSTSEGDG